MRSIPWVWVGVWMWLVQPLYLVLELAAVAAFRAPYSLLANTISDLGSTTCTTIAYPLGPVPVCSPAHGLVNAAFVVFGLLTGVGAVLLRPRLPPGRLVAAATVLWVVAGVSSVATGLVPLTKTSACTAWSRYRHSWRSPPH